MGRFDALNNLEETQEKITPPPVVPSPIPKPTQPEPHKKQNESVKKPEIMKTRNHESKPKPLELMDKPDKYSTLIDASLVKKIKIYSVENDMKGYQVIAQALTEFFEKNK